MGSIGNFGATDGLENLELFSFDSVVDVVAITVGCVTATVCGVLTPLSAAVMGSAVKVIVEKAASLLVDDITTTTTDAQTVTVTATWPTTTSPSPTPEESTLTVTATWPTITSPSPTPEESTLTVTATWPTAYMEQKPTISLLDTVSNNFWNTSSNSTNYNYYYDVNQNDLNQRNIIEVELVDDKFLNEIMSFVVYFLIIGVISWITNYLSTVIFAHKSQKTLQLIRTKVLSHVLNEDMDWHEKNKSKNISSRVNENVEAIEHGIGENMGKLMQFVMAFLSSVIFAFIQGWLLTLVCLVAVPFTALTIFFIANWTSNISEQIYQSDKVSRNIVNEVIQYIKIVTAYDGQDKECERYAKSLIKARDVNVIKGMFTGIGFGIIWFITFASYSFAFWYAVRLYVDEDRGYDSDAIFTVFFAIMMGTMSLTMAIPYFFSFNKAREGLNKIKDLFKRENNDNVNNVTENNDQKNIEQIIPETCEGYLTFTNVHFNHPRKKEKNILNCFNLEIDSGDKVAIIGENGCGKTIILDLIKRFYEPDRGTIELDDNNLATINVNWLRSQIGIVEEDPDIFSTTIYDNISIGCSDALPADIHQVSRAVGIHEFISKLPNKYFTKVGENGISLTRIQKQRLGMARALLRKPKVILMDDVYFNLNYKKENIQENKKSKGHKKLKAKNEEEIEQRDTRRALRQLIKDITIIAVTSSPSLVKELNEIYILKDGVIQAKGSHEELNKSNEYYQFLLKNEQLYTEENIEDKGTETYQVIDENKFPTRKEFFNRMKIVLDWNRPEWILLIIGYISAFICGAAKQFFAIILGLIIQTFTLTDYDELQSQINRYSLYFVIVGIVIGISTFLQTYCLGKSGECLKERTRNIYFKSISHKDIGWFEEKINYSIGNQLMSDTNYVEQLTGRSIGLMIQGLSTFIVAIFLALILEWRLGLVMLGFSPFLLGAIYLQIKFGGSDEPEAEEEMKPPNQLAKEAYKNIRTLKALGNENEIKSNYTYMLMPAIKKAKRNSHIRGAFYGLSSTLMHYIHGTCIGYGGHLVASGVTAVSTVFIINQAMLMGTLAIANAFEAKPNFKKGILAINKIMNLFEKPSRIYIRNNLITNQLKDEIKSFAGRIEYKDVCFTYPRRRRHKVLNNFTMTVDEGKTAIVLSKIGGGKSAILNLLERFYERNSGKIIIGNEDIIAYHLNKLRGMMSMILNKNNLFKRTVFENIAYGDNSRTVTMNEVIEMTKKVNVHNTITALPLGYETVISEDDDILSEKDKKLIILARAILRKPQILLEDNTNDSIELAKDNQLRGTLKEIRANFTCILLRNRIDSDINDADVIYFMENGKNMEHGTHQELMNKRGKYYSFYNKQDSEE